MTYPSQTSDELFAKAAQQQQTGQLRLAEQNFRMALAINPLYAEAENSLGQVLVAQGKAIEALNHFQQALSIKPNFADARNNIIQTLFMLSEKDLAPEVIKKNPAVRNYIERAKRIWPKRLPAKELLAADGIPEIAKDVFLLFFLASTRLRDCELEQLFTSIRAVMLKSAVAADGEPSLPPHILAFYCALARQCFINEYVFSQSSDETEQAKTLGKYISTMLESGATAPMHQLAAYAAYFPLNSLPKAEILLKQSWPRIFQSLEIQQVSEPLEELRLRESIVRLTTIDNNVSQIVQDQYEENPYPRWVSTALPQQELTINQYLHGLFPHSDFQSINYSKGLDLLVAGCGTGQIVATFAKLFKGARILAVDLSLASLSYAKRMIQALGISNVEFAQADILKLSSIDRKFDLISSTGVLHHMADPLAAWQGLLSMLRPGGVMNIGLYSELARQNISEAWKFIEEGGYSNNPDDIRRCREAIISLPDGARMKNAIFSLDFYSLSDCRDLLFHVHELRLTIPQIKQFLTENHLNFIGFDFDWDATEHQKYLSEFPNDRARTNLAQWHNFEKKYPATFSAMYKFWVQKRSI